MPSGLRSVRNAALPPRWPATPSPPRRSAPSSPCWSAPPATSCPPQAPPEHLLRRRGRVWEGYEVTAVVKTGPPGRLTRIWPVSPVRWRLLRGLLEQAVGGGEIGHNFSGRAL